jgi:hypothetical protein
LLPFYSFIRIIIVNNNEKIILPVELAEQNAICPDTTVNFLLPIQQLIEKAQDYADNNFYRDWLMYLTTYYSCL